MTTAPDLAYDVVFDDMLFYSSDAAETAVLTTEAAWNGYLSAFVPPLDDPEPVDFSTRQVLVAHVESMDNTCELVLDAIDVVSLSDGSAQLDIHVTDRSATCDETCSVRAMYVFAVSVPNDRPGAACARHLCTCESAD